MWLVCGKLESDFDGIFSFIFFFLFIDLQLMDLICLFSSFAFSGNHYGSFNGVFRICVSKNKSTQLVLYSIVNLLDMGFFTQKM